VPGNKFSWAFIVIKLTQGASAATTAVNQRVILAGSLPDTAGLSMPEKMLEKRQWLQVKGINTGRIFAVVVQMKSGLKFSDDFSVSEYMGTQEALVADVEIAMTAWLFRASPYPAPFCFRLDDFFPKSLTGSFFTHSVWL
jgi:hypothetical protein